MAGLVVLHVSDDSGDITRALSAAELITATQPMRVQIIVNGPAVEGLVGAGPALRPAEGVSVVACERALERKGLTSAQLRPDVGSVASAVLTLAQAQHEGAAYIRI